MGVKNHCNKYLYLGFGEKPRKKSGPHKLSYVHGSQCLGYRHMYSTWHDNSESSLLGDASGKIPRPFEISELDCEYPNRGLLEGEESDALQWIKEIEAAKSLDDFPPNHRHLPLQGFNGRSRSAAQQNLEAARTQAALTCSDGASQTEATQNQPKFMLPPPLREHPQPWREPSWRQGLWPRWPTCAIQCRRPNVPHEAIPEDLITLRPAVRLGPTQDGHLQQRCQFPSWR